MFGDAMLHAHYQGTMYSKEACSDKLALEQKQTLRATDAMLLRGIDVLFMGQKVLVRR